ncbi:hypothetical protein ACLB0R_12590 [Sphingomonas sp. GlSt437]|uniref:hypothetical protein n=1 Tax=Sphingomonas sp. GlSt437 TaxID=3389970 RepID=UPI003A88927F
MPQSFRTPLLLLAVAFASRWLALGNPVLHVDEQFYYAAARGWAAGQVPYVDFYDRKPIGLFLIYLPAAHLPLRAGVWAYQLMALASAWATALIACSIARRAGVPGRGLAAGVLYLVWIVLAEGQGGQSPVFFNLLTAAAAWLVLEGEGEPPLTTVRTVAAMALFGLALQVKPSVVFEGAFFGLWSLWRRRQQGDSLPRVAVLATAMIGVALLPTALVAASFAASGHFAPWWFATIVAISMRNPPPLAESAGNLGILILLLSPLVSMAVIALRRSPHLARRPRLMLAGWLASAIAGLLIFGTWFEHYGLPTMLPASIAAAGLFSESRRGWRWPVVALVVAAIGGQAILLKKRWERGTPDQFDRVVAAVGRGPGCLYVYAGDSMLYPASGRCAATRYTFPAFLTRNTETVAIDQRGEIARILASQPAVIVDSGPFRGELPQRRAQLLAATARDYQAVARLPEGRSLVTVYKRIS